MKIKVEKQKLKKYFTCPICNNFFNDATTISECTDTFCRKCIEGKLKKEKLKACPVCNVDLGVAPLARLRNDNIKNDARVRFLPLTETSRKEKKTLHDIVEVSQSSRGPTPNYFRKLPNDTRMQPHKKAKNGINKEQDHIGLAAAGTSCNEEAAIINQQFLLISYDDEEVSNKKKKSKGQENED